MFTLNKSRPSVIARVLPKQSRKFLNCSFGATFLAMTITAHAICDEEGRCANLVFSPRTGIDWAQMGKSQHIQLLSTDMVPDYFETTQETSSQMLFGAFLGGELMNEDTSFRWQTGLAYYQPHVFTSEGIDYFFI